MRRNIMSILGPNPLLWCCPTHVSGSGLKYELSDKDGECDMSSAPQARARSQEDIRHLA